MSGTGKTFVRVSPTGNPLIDGLLSGNAWGPGSITYAFPTLASSYTYTAETSNNFGAISLQQQAAALFTLDTEDGNTANDAFSVEGFTNLNVSLGNVGDANIRFAQSDAAAPTAYAYYPDTWEGAGDVWFSTQYAGTANDYRNPDTGDYAWYTMIHEIGHALGLKHGHEAPALPYEFDSSEYTVMTYRSYVGASSDGTSQSNDSYPQTFMMLDILALQTMYGADYTANSGDTVYKWNANKGDTLINGAVALDAVGQRVFATLWDGSGIDTYDLSSYRSGVVVDLAAGGHSVFSSNQLARLGNGVLASGNIYNAMLFGGNEASLIENAWGGSGNDSLFGNQAANELIGNAGNDTIRGLAGADILTGGRGKDVFQFTAVADSASGGVYDSISDFAFTGKQRDRIDLSLIDANGLTAENDAFSFIGAGAFSGVAGQLRFSGGVVEADINGDMVADFAIAIATTGNMTATAFVL